jgi:hypothetical protein
MTRTTRKRQSISNNSGVSTHAFSAACVAVSSRLRKRRISRLTRNLICFQYESTALALLGYEEDAALLGGEYAS